MALAMSSSFMSLPEMAVRPPFHREEGRGNNSRQVSQQGSRPATNEFGTGLLKAASLPALDRPPSNMFNRSSGLPPGVVNFKDQQEAGGYRAPGLPRVNEISERPGTSQCQYVLENMMTSRMGKKPPSRQKVGFRDLPPSSMNMSVISVQSTPKAPNDNMYAYQVSSCLEQLPAKTAARARMRSLKNFYAMPPRPVSRARDPLPYVTLMGVHGGQAFPAEDWNYKHHGSKTDRRVRNDHIAGDLGRN